MIILVVTPAKVGTKKQVVGSTKKTTLKRKSSKLIFNLTN